MVYKLHYDGIIMSLKYHSFIDCVINEISETQEFEFDKTLTEGNIIHQVISRFYVTRQK